MQEDALFTDERMVKTVTPYRKLRELRGWSLEKAADIFHLSKKTLINIELGRSDPPKQIVRHMDREYGCGGKLINYWIPTFSFLGKKITPRSFSANFKAWVKFLLSQYSTKHQ